MPIAEITALVTSIKAAIDIAKGLKSVNDAHAITQAQTEILEKLFALQVGALDLQEKHLALINEKEELQKKLNEFMAWEKTESEYEFQQPERGKFVYVSKSAQQSQQQPHYLCTNCWSNRQKSILQASWHNEYEAHYTCPRCKTGYHFHFKDQPPMKISSPFDELGF